MNSCITSPIRIKKSISIFTTIFSLFWALSCLPPKSSAAAIILEGQYNGGAPANLGLNGTSNDIWLDFRVVKNYQLQVIASASETHFNISFTSVYPFGQTIENEVFRLQIFAKMAPAGPPLWSIDLKFDLDTGGWLSTIDRVIAKDIWVTHHIAPHPGENPNNQVNPRDLEMDGTGKPLFGRPIGTTGDSTKNNNMHGDDMDIVVATLFGRKEVIPDAAGRPTYGNDFTEWSLQVKAQHVPEPSSIFCLATLALPLARTLRRKT